VGELISRSEQDLLDIRNFGAKSIDEVKAKLHEMGLSLKDSAPGFDPQAPSRRTTTTTTLRRGRAVLIRTERSLRRPPADAAHHLPGYLTRPGRNEKRHANPKKGPRLGGGPRTRS
jgi:hypothetical protein